MKSRAARSPCHLLRNSLFSSFTVGCQNATGDFRPALPDKPQREPRSLSSADTGAIVTRRFLFFLLAFLILTCTAYAAPLQPGFKTLGIWDPAKNVRLDFAVWYPSRSAPFQVNYGDWNFSAARGRPPVEGKHPLILLSHDSAGSRFSLHELASELARNGFVVLAFTHPGDNVDDMGALFMPVQVTDRAKQLTQALDIALADPETARSSIPIASGVLGVGPEATAAAHRRQRGWTRRLALYCAGKEENADPYCHAVGTAAQGAFSTTPNLSAPYRDRRVRAAAAVSPSYAMMFTPASLSRIRIPLLLLRAERTPLYTLQHAERLLSAMPQPPQLGVLPDADTASLMSSCGGNLDQTLPEMCLAVSPSRRKAVQAKMAAESAAFFLKYLGTPNPPPLPPEPEDNPQITSHPATPEKNAGPQEEAVEIRRWTKNKCGRCL